MGNTFAQNLKQAIVNDIQSLVSSGVLGSVATDDFTKLNPLNRTWGKFPAALVIPPTVGASEYEDVVTNLREYTWYIMIVTTPDNLPKNDPTYLEGLIDNVLQVFDNDVTLQGMAVGGVNPAILDPPGPVSSGAVTYVTAYVTIKARALVPAAVQ
ncbi:MAG TPA: hypothetical protein VKR52_04655 [Terracidiphilus sp.]|nr:hypothetical protein [Terracidiphilus sp.]